jgi:hypothetical protein
MQKCHLSSTRSTIARRTCAQVPVGLFFDWVETITPVWAPYYTIHKTMQGLLDQYTVAGNSMALVMVVKMTNYFSDRGEECHTEL